MPGNGSGRTGSQPNDRQKIIFISYRRGGPKSYLVEKIDAYLRREDVFGRAGVFRDVDIPVGADVPDHLGAALTLCDTFVSVIGRDWLRPQTPGNIDWFQKETEAALAARFGIKIIPIVTEEIPSPNEFDDHPCFRRLLGKQGLRLTLEDAFEREMEDLVGIIQRARIASVDAPPQRHRRANRIVSPLRWMALGGAIAVTLTAAIALSVGRWTKTSDITNPPSANQDAKPPSANQDAKPPSANQDAKPPSANQDAKAPLLKGEAPSAGDAQRATKDSDARSFRRPNEEVLLIATHPNRASADAELHNLAHGSRTKACLDEEPTQSCVKLVAGTSFAVLVAGGDHGWSPTEAKQMRACLSRGLKRKSRPIMRSGRLYVGRCL